METPRTARAALAGLTSILLLGALAACATPAGDSQGGSGEGGIWSAAEVAEASGSYAVTPLFAVPKDVEDLQLAFLNPGRSYAFFAAWSEGMQDAADFYGVTVSESDLEFKYEEALSAYEQQSIKQPVVVGSGGGAMNEVTLQAAVANGAKVVLIDGGMEGALDFGVSDEQVGILAVTTIADAVKEKLDGEWAGRDLLVVGISSASCEPCDARVRASFTEAQEQFGIDESATLRLEPPAVTDPATDAGTVFTDVLTANPDAVVVVVSYGDAPVVGAVNAARAADRGADILAIASGGDATSRAALREPANAGILLGSIDYQPYSEGWNWVEAAIAAHLGETFAPYEVTRVLTADNVDEFYPED